MQRWRDCVLRKPHQFQHVWSHGQCFKTHWCYFYWQDVGLPHGRLGIVASKKSYKLAVHRNAIKRLHRTLFRQCDAETLKMDVIVVVRRRPTLPEYHALLDCWSRFCASLKC